MGKHINIILVVICIVCCYAIFQIKLDWFWDIGTFKKAEQLNSIIINLSYSYIAGLIMYVLTIALPSYLHKQKINVIIKENINDIGALLHNLLVGFPYSKDGVCNPDISNIEECKQILTNVDWNTTNRLPIYNHIPNKLYQTFHYDYKQLQEYITSFLQIYKSDLTATQLLLLNDLSQFKNLSILELIIKSNCVMINELGDDIANEFAEKLKTYSKLKNTL